MTAPVLKCLNCPLRNVINYTSASGAHCRDIYCQHPSLSGTKMVDEQSGGVPYWCPKRYRFVDYNPRGHQWGSKRSGGWSVCDWCNAVEGSEEAGERCPQAKAWADDPEWHRVSKYGDHAVGYKPPYPEPPFTDGDPAGRVAGGVAAAMLYDLRLANLRHWALYGDPPESRERARRELLRLGKVTR